MPRYIIKFSKDQKDYYLEWSTVVDAPVSLGMSLEQFKDWYRVAYGENSMKELEERLERVQEKGCSSMIHKDLDELISYNRAGPKESCLSYEQLVEICCNET